MARLDLMIWAAALASGLWTLWRDRDRAMAALRIARAHFGAMAAPLLLMLTAAAFLTPLLPLSLVSAWIGSQSGMTGVMVASLVGGLIPGGPVISFPLVVALSAAGAGTAQLIALLAAWSVVAIHRLIAFEFPLMGAAFTWRRLLVSLPLPPIAGFLALLFES